MFINDSFRFRIKSLSLLHKNILANLDMFFKCFFIEFSSTWWAFFQTTLIIIIVDGRLLLYLWSVITVLNGKIISLVLEILPLLTFIILHSWWYNIIWRMLIIVYIRNKCLSKIGILHILILEPTPWPLWLILLLLIIVIIFIFVVICLLICISSVLWSMITRHCLLASYTLVTLYRSLLLPL